MSKKLTQEEVRHVANLARLNCTNREIAAFTTQLSAILDYFSQLDEIEILAHYKDIDEYNQHERGLLPGWLTYFDAVDTCKAIRKKIELTLIN